MKRHSGSVSTEKSNARTWLGSGLGLGLGLGLGVGLGVGVDLDGREQCAHRLVGAPELFRRACKPRAASAQLQLRQAMERDPVPKVRLGNTTRVPV